MLYTRNAKFFREYYKVVKAQNRDTDVDINFIDLKHPNPTSYKKGFGSLIFGSGRDNVESFLRSTVLNVAADQQSVYELIQNADDCDASFINISYNDKYLLCINNGKPFSDRNMAGLINVGDSDKTLEEIGTYGIGFKIVHRLLGEDDGADAIIKNYAGAIIFSWNKFTQFERFLSNDEIIVGRNKERDNENPWLIKLIYTCFPTHLGESIRVSNYDSEKVLFENSELDEFRSFLSESLSNISISKENLLHNGSMFFLKIAEGKSKSVIEKNIEILKSGIAYSFNFLQSLNKIYINGESILAQEVKTHPIVYPKDSSQFISINPRNKERQIEAKFGFTHSFKDRIPSDIPNFYTFFSMDDEKNNLGFLIHCNAFDKHSDRRKLQPDSQSNPRLFSHLIADIFTFVNSKKGSRIFNELYATFLLAEEPKNKPQILEGIYLPIKKYLLENIPTLNRTFSKNSQNIKIKNTRLQINPVDLGCPEIEWFAWWDNEDTKELIKESQKPEKLGLQKWNIVDLFKHAISKGKPTEINAWIRKIEVETAQIFAEEKQQKEANTSQELPKKNKPYISLLTELNDRISTSSKSDVDVISQIKLFKFSDGNYYSLNQIFSSQNIILQEDNLSSIWGVLNYKLDFIVSEQKISRYKHLYAIYQDKVTNLALFQKIATKIKPAAQSEEQGKRLNPDQKKKLFLVLLELSKDAEGKIDAKRIRDIEMFSDTQKRVIPLRKLIKGNSQVPDWLFGFKMNQYEDMPELSEYCIKEEEIYKNIILENWESVIFYEKLNAYYFYSKLLKYYEVSKDKELLETKKLPFVATQNGFKKVSEIYFNPSLKDLGNLKYCSLQELISKVSQRELPRFDVFSHFTDKNSPLRITENQSITSFLVNCENLEYHEVEALLTFAKLTKDNIFEQVYIESKNNRFSIVKHSKSVFQYYSNRQEINELLSNQPNFKLLPKEFNANDFQSLGISQGKELYLKVLQTLEFSEKLLPIVQESDKEVQLVYLEKLKNFSLQEGKVYDKNSFEHRCLKLAIDCYADDFQTKFAKKILINESLRIKDIAVKDDINFEGFKTHLSTLLPSYKGKSDIITNIIKQFTDGAELQLSVKVFPFGNKDKKEIFQELQQNTKSIQDIEQFGFMLYYSKQTNSNCFSEFDLTQISDTDKLQFCFKQNFVEVNKYQNLGLQDKVYPSELALETEKLPTWVLSWLESADKQEKLNFLSALGVHTENSNVCAIRRFFQTGQNIDVQAKVVALSQVLLLNTLKWLQSYTFKASESTKFEGLKQIFNRLNYTNEIPLLYISQITETETLYNLEVTTASKYYFEIPQKGYSQKIFVVLQNKGFKLIALDYFKHWQTSIPNLNEVQTTFPLDIATLKNDSAEWEDSAYNQWKANQNYKVAIYKGEKLPHKVLFLETEIDTFTEGTSIEKEGIIYVCQSVKHDIRNTLSKYINADELIKLYQIDNNNSDIVQTLQSRISQLEEVINNLLAGTKSSNWNNSDTFFDDFNQVVTEREYNLITGYKAEAYVYEQLKNQEFKNVVWTNQTNAETTQKITQSGKTYFIDEKGEPYDLTFIDDKGRLCYVQVKATTTTFDRADDVKMIITKREWLFLQNDNYKDVYYMTRVFSARDYPSMKFFKMELKIG